MNSLDGTTTDIRCGCIDVTQVGDLMKYAPTEDADKQSMEELFMGLQDVEDSVNTNDYSHWRYECKG